MYVFWNNDFFSFYWVCRQTLLVQGQLLYAGSDESIENHQEHIFRSLQRSKKQKFHFFDDIRNFRWPIELCSASMNFQKSPFACVCDHRIWSKRRTTIPVALEDRCDHKEAWKRKFYLIKSYKKFLGRPWSHCRHLRKLSFLRSLCVVEYAHDNDFSKITICLRFRA